MSNVRVGGARSAVCLLLLLLIEIDIASSEALSSPVSLVRLPVPSGVGGGVIRVPFVSSIIDLVDGVAVALPLSLTMVRDDDDAGTPPVSSESSSLVRSTVDERANTALACAASTSGDVSLPRAERIERTELLVVGVALAVADGAVCRGVS